MTALVNDELETRESPEQSPSTSILRPSSAAPRFHAAGLDSSSSSRRTSSRSGIEVRMAAIAQRAQADAELRDLFEHGPKEASRTGHVNPKHYNINVLQYDSFLRPHAAALGGYDPRSLSLYHTRFPLSSNAGRAVRGESAGRLAANAPTAAAKRAPGSMLTSASAGGEAGSNSSSSSSSSSSSCRDRGGGSNNYRDSSSGSTATTAASSSVKISGGASSDATGRSNSLGNQIEVARGDLAAAELAPPLCLKCGQLADKEVTRYRRVRAVGFKHIFDKAQQQHGQRERELRLRQVMSVWRAHTRTRKLRDKKVRQLYSFRSECLLRKYYSRWLQGALRQASRRQQSRLADKLAEREREIRKLTVQLELALQVQTASAAT
jgi:hypothetical protein